MRIPAKASWFNMLTSLSNSRVHADRPLWAGSRRASSSRRRPIAVVNLKTEMALVVRVCETLELQQAFQQQPHLSQFTHVINIR